jgi:hypothetical protein
MAAFFKKPRLELTLETRAALLFSGCTNSLEISALSGELANDLVGIFFLVTAETPHIANEAKYYKVKKSNVYSIQSIGAFITNRISIVKDGKVAYGYDLKGSCCLRNGKL